MPWESRTVKEQREAFVEAVSGSRNFSALCREFGITRKTGYKWIRRYREGEPLSDRSHRPGTNPNKTPAAVEESILELRRENPGWGGKKIKQVLETEGKENIPSARTVGSILLRNGMIAPEESQKHTPFRRFARDKCNELWQADFKGEFCTKDGKYCYPLDILDDHSRFSIRIQAFPSTAGVTIPAFEAAFREYGLPDAVLSDNGAQFAGFRHGYTHFERWLMDLDVLPIHGRLKHPQTQGKIERFHRSMKSELLAHEQFADCEEANAALNRWRDKYNNRRPHEALGMKCPAQIYIPSSRSLPERIAPYEYDGRFRVLTVNSWGYIRFDRYQVYLSETMCNRHIEFRPGNDGETFWACYRNFRIAEFSTDDGHLVNRLIRRL
jgi:transposase InsO family protein